MQHQGQNQDAKKTLIGLNYGPNLFPIHLQSAYLFNHQNSLVKAGSPKVNPSETHKMEGEEETKNAR